MSLATKTLAAINAAIIANQEPPFRKHMGASLIGKECSRRIWYDFRWTLVENFDARILRLFGDGHHLEPRVAKWLRDAGVELWEAGEFGENKAQMRISAHEGHFGGTPDFIGRRIPDLADPMEPCLVEVKTHNDKSFAKLAADGVMKTKWEHFVQMQMYMGGLNLKWALYISYNKNDSSIHSEMVAFDEREFQRATDRAESIIWTEEPPARIGKSPAHFGCKFCNLQRLCYFGDVQPARNCRSCAFSIPAEGGQWQCMRNGAFLDEAAQRAGCDSYQVNPKLKQPIA